MSATAKGTLVLVHGGFHGPWCWDRVIPMLTKLGWRTVCPDLPVESARATLHDYAAAVAEAVKSAPACDPTILVAHSMAGCVVPAVPALTDVAGIIFLSPVLPDWFHPADPPADVPPMSLIDPAIATSADDQGRSVITADAARTHFYRDCSEADVAMALGRLRPQGLGWLSETGPAALSEVSYAWILCAGDRCVDPAWQRWAARVRLGVEPSELAGGHSLFITRPGDLAAALDECAEATTSRWLRQDRTLRAPVAPSESSL